MNHLGHFALTGLLLPALLTAAAARVVTVTSTAHHLGRRLDPANPNLEGCYRPFEAYGQSKLANFHFGIGLQRRFERAGARAASVLAHPGLTRTDLLTVSATEPGGSPLPPFWEQMTRLTGMTPADGALSQLRAAHRPTRPRWRLPGAGLGERRAAGTQARSCAGSASRAAIDSLWHFSEQATDVMFPAVAPAGGPAVGAGGIG